MLYETLNDLLPIARKRHKISTAETSESKAEMDAGVL
jgi:hypothetical protein